MYAETRVHRLHSLLRRNRYVGRILDTGQHDDELVAAHPGDYVRFTYAFPKPFGNVLQHEVPERVSKRVVDDFEPVEIKKQQRNLLISPASVSQGIFQVFL